MAPNPYAPPQAHDEGPWTSSEQRVDAAEAERIRVEIKRLNRTSLMLGAPGLLVQVVGNAMGGTTGAFVTLVGTVLLVTGLTYYARRRGRSPWYGAVGRASCLGMFFLYLLPKHCHHCTATTKGPTCDKCGAPAPM
jgi:hypothetical protein